MNTSPDKYLRDGCGRCPLGGTPDCKVHKWTAELELLRQIALDCGLEEVSKWGVLCYMYGSNNVFLISAFNDYCSISFFKGSLLHDAQGLLVKPGKNTRAARLLKFTDLKQIQEMESDIKTMIFEAIEVEKAGLKPTFKKNPEPIPEELEAVLEGDPVLKSAFEALTPGRQRGYILYFSAPKQSKTRVVRIEKSMGKILNGEGLHDYYKK